MIDTPGGSILAFVTALALSACSSPAALQPVALRLTPDGLHSVVGVQFVPESKLYLRKGEDPTPPIVLRNNGEFFTVAIVRCDLDYSPINVWFSNNQQGPPVQVYAGTVQVLNFPATKAISIQQALIQEDPGSGVGVSL